MRPIIYFGIAAVRFVRRCKLSGGSEYQHDHVEEKAQGDGGKHPNALGERHGWLFLSGRRHRTSIPSGILESGGTGGSFHLTIVLAPCAPLKLGAQANRRHVDLR